jgi:hypothetical protein
MTDKLAEIKESLELVDDRIGPDSSLRWLVKEVDRLRFKDNVTTGELKVLETLVERMVTRLGEGFIVNPVSVEPLALASSCVYKYRGLLSEQAAIHDLAAEALGYEQAPSLEDDPKCPCPEAFNTGDHTAQTLVMELVNTYKELLSKLLELEAQSYGQGQ